MTLPARTPECLVELTGDRAAIIAANDDTPLWLEAVDREIRRDLRALVAGVIAALGIVALIWSMKS